MTLRKWWDRFFPILRISQEPSAFLQASLTFHGTEISIPVTKCLFSACSRDIKNVPSNVLQWRYMEYEILKFTRATKEMMLTTQYAQERTYQQEIVLGKKSFYSVVFSFKETDNLWQFMRKTVFSIICQTRAGYTFYFNIFNYIFNGPMKDKSF